MFVRALKKERESERENLFSLKYLWYMQETFHMINC